MTAPHIPVMLSDVVEALSPQAGEVIADATFGAGGYTQALLDAGAKVLAFDRDPDAITAGARRFATERAAERLALIEMPFDRLAEEVLTRAPSGLDGVVFDFGVSSMQLDQAKRGFSFMRDGPLDMRMGQGSGEGPTAADFVNEAAPDELKTVFWQYGEERRAGHLAAAIARQRQLQPFETTSQLAAIAGAPRAKDKIHPATRMFQAIRILVNDELGQIIRALMGAERVLKEGGRLVAVTFHSLEDRLIKRFLSTAAGADGGPSRHQPQVERPEPSFALASRKGRAASDDEAAKNPRARSAKLRAARRTGAPCTLWTREKLRALGAPSLVFSDLQAQWSC